MLIGLHFFAAIKRLTLYLTLVLLSLTYLLHAASSQQTDPAQPSDHKQQSAPPPGNSKSSVVLGKGKESNAQPQSSPPNREGTALKQEGLDYTFWAFVINGVLALVTVVIAIAGIIQALAAKEAANIATNSQRSWIVEDGIDDPDLTGVWIARATCHFKVFGSSPVRVTEAKFRFHVVKSRSLAKRNLKEPDLPENPDYGELDTLASNPQMGKVYSPGDEFAVVPMLDGLFFEDGDLAAIKAGEKFLCIYGFMRYRDAFSRSKIRETRFSYVHGEQHPLGLDKRQFITGGPPAYNEVT